LRSDNRTGYKGVSWHRGKFIARVGYFGKRIELLYTDDVIEAAQAYNIAAALLHGEFSLLNDVPPPTAGLIVSIESKVNRLFNTGGFLTPEDCEVTA